ncbi:uncharacterized protein LOC110023717, partial [Phalaenopsis equestris]|uniref:uncharacterized protein LOC110023717 n=1 Tax=Phalaenopsis equestris TaxID=78828 RepID=UPI0009E5840D
LLELALGIGSEAITVKVDKEVLTMKSLQDAIQSFVIKKAEPGWLPFSPGASYRAPPSPESLTESDPFDRLDNLLTMEEKLFCTLPILWMA